MSVSLSATTFGFTVSSCCRSFLFFAWASSLACPASSFSIASVILALHASVCGKVVLLSSKMHLHPGQPSVAPCLCTSSLLMYTRLCCGGATRSSLRGGTTRRSSSINCSPAGLAAECSHGKPRKRSQSLGSQRSAELSRRIPVPLRTPSAVITKMDPVRPWCPT